MDVSTEEISKRQFQAEMAVIGSLCIDPAPVAGIVFHRLRPEDFSEKTYRTVFTAARDMWLNGHPLDAVLIAKAAGGGDVEQALATAMRLTPTAANVEAYVDIVAEEAQLRRLREIGMQLSLHLEDLESAKKLLADAEGLLAAQREERVWTYKDLLEDYLAWINEEGKPDYLDWGIAELNRKVKIAPGSFVVIGAPSSTGKTAFALQLAYNIARSGKRVGFFSYETPKRTAAIRLFANTASIDMAKAKDRNVSAVDIDALMREGNISMNLPFTLEDSGNWTADDLRARTLGGRYEVIFIDYVQLIPGDPRRPRWEIVTETSMKLHRMAQTLGVTVVALSQVTLPAKEGRGSRRAVEKDDLRESKQLINDAEAVLMMDLTKPDDYTSERMLKIAKNKDGELGTFGMKFEPRFMRFTPCEKPEHLKRQEYNEGMARVRQSRKQSRPAEQRDPEWRQGRFEELDGEDDDIPF